MEGGRRVGEGRGEVCGEGEWGGERRERDKGSNPKCSFQKQTKRLFIERYYFKIDIWYFLEYYIKFHII